MAAELVVHPLEPVWNSESRVLILGTMPSPKSREAGFYYGHPQNRFWPVLSAVLGEALPKTREERAAMALRRHIALWDVLASCKIEGAGDSSIREPVPNEFTVLFKEAKLRAVFATGQKAHALYERLVFPKTGLHAFGLPSTSPANRRVSQEALIEAYRAILPFLTEECV